MSSKLVIHCAQSVGWDSFHSAFAEAMGFPDFFGRNLDALRDCVTCVDDPASPMTRVKTGPDGTVRLSLGGEQALSSRQSEICRLLMDVISDLNKQRCVILVEPTWI